MFYSNIDIFKNSINISLSGIENILRAEYLPGRYTEVVLELLQGTFLNVTTLNKLKDFPLSGEVENPLLWLRFSKNSRLKALSPINKGSRIF